MPAKQYDVFICHASEDKDVARTLAEQLVSAGVRVWYDEFAIEHGSRIVERIDRGLARSRYAVVILSPAFFNISRMWTRNEIYALLHREIETHREIILPVYHGVAARDVERFSPLLAMRFAISMDAGLLQVAAAICRVVRPDIKAPRIGIEKRVAVAVVRKRCEFLLVRRRRPEKRLRWQFPAGVVKSWEDDSDAAIREVLAETAIRCRLTEKIGERIHPDTGTHITYWLCEYVAGRARLADREENADLGWYAGDQVRRLITSDLYAPINAILDGSL